MNRSAYQIEVFLNSKILPLETDSWTKFSNIVETDKLPHAFITEFRFE